MAMAGFSRLILAALTLPFAAACANSSPVVGTTGSGAGSSSSSSSSTSAGQGGAGTGGQAQGNGGSGGQTTGNGGNGGAATTTTTTTTTTGSGSSDPCAGAADGKHCGGDLGGLADHGSLYTCAGGVTATASACPSGCANGACIQPPADPCASAQFGNGAYCGGTLSGGDPGSLYNCQNGATAGKQGCPAGCKTNPPGVADACNPQGDPCQNAGSGNGAYCGASLASGDPNVLYNCQNLATASQTACVNGCQVNPPGVADACKPGGGGQCCLQHPAGVVTQPYTACGNGGSHYGIDYGTAIGTPIYAGLAGTVVGSALGFPNCYDNGCDAACWNAFNYVKIKSDLRRPFRRLERLLRLLPAHQRSGPGHRQRQPRRSGAARRPQRQLRLLVGAAHPHRGGLGGPGRGRGAQHLQVGRPLVTLL
jgi:hypothetical protein